MERNARINALEPSDVFADGRASRPPVPGTVPLEAELPRPHAGEQSSDTPAEHDSAAPEGHEGHDHAHEDQQGTTGESATDALPVQPATPAAIRRGAERYAIFCASCHGASAEGDGPLIEHGFPAAPSLVQGHGAHHGPAYMHDVISNGTGAMPAFRDRIPPADRMAIIRYLETLQERSGHE